MMRLYMSSVLESERHVVTRCEGLEPRPPGHESSGPIVSDCERFVQNRSQSLTIGPDDSWPGGLGSRPSHRVTTWRSLSSTEDMYNRIIHAAHPDGMRGADNRTLRERHLIGDLFAPDTIGLTYTHYDRLVVGGAAPV